MAQLTYKAYTQQTKPVNFQFTMEGAGCCIIVAEKILFLQRSLSNKFQAGTWGIPAGKLDAGETPEQGAIRETREETGIEILPASMYYRGYIYFSVGYEVPFNYRFHVYTVHLPEYPVVTLEPGQVAFRWVTHNEALQLPVFTGTREVLSLGMRNDNLGKQEAL